MFVLLLITTPSARAPMTITLEDFVAVPMTGMAGGIGNVGSIARVNVLREEPGGMGRFFVSDLNGPLYILDKKTKTFATYLDFNGRDARPGLFDKLSTAAGFANGLHQFPVRSGLSPQRQDLYRSSRGDWRAGVARCPMGRVCPG